MREEARPLLIPDLLDDMAFAMHRGMASSSGVRSMVSVPVLSGGKFIGVLSAHSSEPCRPWQVSGREAIAAEIGKYMQQHSIEG
jgi:GAF domain-containing protein